MNRAIIEASQTILTGLAIGMALWLCATIASADEGLPGDQISEPALRHAKELLQSSPLIDGHNDLPWLIREENGGDVAAFRLDRENEFDTDIPRLRGGLIGAQFWSVWIRGRTAPADTARVQLEQIDVVRRIIDTYPDAFELALTADDIERAFDKGKTRYG